MKISIKEWILFTLIAIFCFFLWHKFAYPQFDYVNLSVAKKEACIKAETYLVSLGVNPKDYLKAVVFESDDWADRYLQKTLGTEARVFIKEHAFELFSWRIRFFKQFQKEEYVIEISPKTGSILRFQHLIEDIAAREQTEKLSARQEAEAFLKNNCGLNLDGYAFHEEKAKRYDNRIDYAFSWEKKGVYIPWKNSEGTAKLLIGATISGKEVREFYKNNLDIPERFRRHIENQLAFGVCLSSISFLLLVGLIIFSIFIVIRKRHTLTSRISTRWFLYLAAFIIISYIVYILNNLQSMLIEYSTSVSMVSFFGVYMVRIVMSLAFLSANFILPAVAGESLCSEVFSGNSQMSFLHYIKSTFFGRSMIKAVFFGYILFFIMLGLQAALFYFGQRYLGVWKEWVRLTQLSSAYLPVLGAFIIAANASLSEEVIFRIFGISWLKKYLKNTFLAIVLSSLIWGFGHSEYAIFPSWFRGIEVSILGVGLGFIFIRYGIMPLLTAHYLFDLFWGASAYILGKNSAPLFFGSIAMLALPLVFAGAAFFLNKDEKEREVKIMLDKTQEYNLGMLITFMSVKKSQGINAAGIREDLIRNNWDIDLIDLAIKEVFKS